MAKHVYPVPHALRQRIVYDVDADMFIRQKRPGRAQEEDGAEQNPLQLKPGVRRDVENLADDRVDRTDNHRDEDGPGYHVTDASVEAIDGTAKPQESTHFRSPKFETTGQSQ